MKIWGVSVSGLVELPNSCRMQQRRSRTVPRGVVSGWPSASWRTKESCRYFAHPAEAVRPRNRVSGEDYGYSVPCRWIEQAMLNANAKAKIDVFAAWAFFSAQPFPLLQRIATAIEED